MRGISSAGRAPALHAGGQEFESPILHHFEKKEPLGALFSCPDLLLRVRIQFNEKIIIYIYKFIGGII